MRRRLLVLVTLAITLPAPATTRAAPGPAAGPPGRAGPGTALKAGEAPEQRAADPARPAAAGGRRATAPDPRTIRGRWPLGPPRPPVLRGWEPPRTPYGPGHRGVDVSTPPGAPVRATAAGHIAFAGPVAGRGVLTLTLTGTGGPGREPLRVTHEPVLALLPRGARVAAGDVLARTAPGRSHCATHCLHWGLRRGREYLNPLTLLPPELLRNGPSRLLPLTGRLPGTGG